MRVLKEKLPSGRYRLRAENPDGTFARLDLYDDEDDAERDREAMREVFRRSGMSRDERTVGGILLAFRASRERVDQQRIDDYILSDPISKVSLRTFCTNDVRRWRKRLEKRKARVRGKGGVFVESDRPLSAKTRRECLILLRVALTDAVDTGILSRNPALELKLPAKEKRKAFGWLYPEEDAQLMACQGVPLPYRLLYGFMAREGTRKSEALALTWADLDLERGVVTLDENKTDDPRAWALDTGVVAALAITKAASGRARPADRVFVGAHGEPLNTLRCARFREHLRKAGMRRPELFARTKARNPIRIHDLRATFVTLNMAAGRTDQWVQDRTGHTTNAMLQAYRRAARTAAEIGLGLLAPLNEALGLNSDPRSDPRSGGFGDCGPNSTPTGEACSGFESRVPLTENGTEPEGYGGRGSDMDRIAALLGAARSDDPVALRAACMAVADDVSARLSHRLALIDRVRAGGPGMVAAAVELLELGASESPRYDTKTA
jgi:integrase